TILFRKCLGYGPLRHATSPPARLSDHAAYLWICILPGSALSCRGGCSENRNEWLATESAPQTEIADQCTIACAVTTLEIIQQLATLVDHFQQTAAGVVIRLVLFKVSTQLGNALGQQRHLDFGRAGIALAAVKLINDGCFFFRGQGHSILQKIDSCSPGLNDPAGGRPNHPTDCTAPFRYGRSLHQTRKQKDFMQANKYNLSAPLKTSKIVPGNSFSAVHA